MLKSLMRPSNFHQQAGKKDDHFPFNSFLLLLKEFLFPRNANPETEDLIRLPMPCIEFL